MDLGYNPVTKLSSADLMMGHDPVMQFEFVGVIPYGLKGLLGNWARDGNADDKLLLTLAPKVFVAVTPEGRERIALGTPERITEFVEASDLDFLREIITSWVGYIGQQMLAEKKASMPSASASISGNGRKSRTPK